MLRFRFVVVVAFAIVSGAGCSHTSDTQKKNEARGHYEVSIAIVQEAQKAGEIGDNPGRDAKFREALKELLDSEKGNDADPEVQLLLAQVYFLGFRRHDDAITHLNKAIALKAAASISNTSPAEREYPEAEQTLGVVLVDKGTPEAALPHFEKARTNLLYSTPFFAEQEMGSALFALGRHDAAAQHLGLAIQQQPDLCGAYARLADVEEARGDNARQQKVLGEFLARCDSDRLRAAVSAKLLGPAFFKLGESFLRTGDKAAAVDAFRAGASRFPSDPAGLECARRLEMLGASLRPDAVSNGVSSGG